MQRKTVVLRALKDASAFLKKKFHAGLIGTQKADGTLVSEADFGSEKRILDVLRKAFPDDAVLSEECGEIAGTSGYRWILDPLDGTHNFLAGIPIFGILLALEKGGKIILSFCVFPMTGEVFVAEKGKGAFLNGKRIHVSPAKTVANTVFLADGNSNVEFNAIMKDIAAFQAKGCKFRMLGEGPFGMTKVALGTAAAAIMYLP